jgi:hypothetical protein
MKWAMALILVLAATCLPLAAQTNSMVTANIPFAFYVGDKLYPAGEYLFNSADLPGSFLCISGSPKRYVMTGDVQRIDTVTESKLVFQRDGDKMVLHQVWVAGDNHVHDIFHKQTVHELPH